MRFLQIGITGPLSPWKERCWCTICNSKLVLNETTLNLNVNIDYDMHRFLYYQEDNILLTFFFIVKKIMISINTKFLNLKMNMIHTCELDS